MYKISLEACKQFKILLSKPHPFTTQQKKKTEIFDPNIFPILENVQKIDFIKQTKGYLVYILFLFLAKKKKITKWRHSKETNGVGGVAFFFFFKFLFLAKRFLTVSRSNRFFSPYCFTANEFL